MNIEKYFCRFGHGCNLFCIGTIGDVDQTAVVVLSVTATGHLLVTPLEIAGADKGGVSICVLGIISIGDTPLLLIFNLPQRLGKSVVDSSEMIFADDHGKVHIPWRGPSS